MSLKVLIVSNNEFCLTESNGRVLGTLLQCISNEEKLQFCINGSSVSSALITESYRISDKTVLKGVLSSKIRATKLPCDLQASSSAKKKKKIKRTAGTMLIRDLVWKSCLSRLEFFDLAKQFHPDIILWQYGDSGFMADLVRQLALKFESKLVVFTTEDYYFKTWDYFAKKDRSFSYKLFSSEMKYATKKAFDMTTLCIANTPQLAERFERAFKCRTEVIMNSSEITQIGVNFGTQIENRIVYAGNLGINRHLSIISIARALKRIDPSIHFEVYGKPEETVAKMLEAEENIYLMGFVSYQEITQIIKQSRLVIHAESFEDFYRYDLKAAFSTKITDALVSGTPLFIYAPEELAETDYLVQNSCAFVCTDETDLDDRLRCALYDDVKRESIIAKGKEIVYKNHNAEKNSQRMLELLQSILEEL